MPLTIIQPSRFTCPRTCTPGHACRFMPIIAALGRTRVYSHTVQVTVELRDKGPLGAAVLAMGGTVIGEGSHSLFSSTESGYAFQLPEWAYPIILRSDNTLAYDDYHGMWGNVSDLETLRASYAIEAARQAADQQGWMSYDQEDGALEIHHPNGGKLLVQSDGTVDAIGFIGSACDVAQVIEDALGTPGEKSFKPEYYQLHGLTV